MGDRQAGGGNTGDSDRSASPAGGRIRPTGHGTEGQAGLRGTALQIQMPIAVALHSTSPEAPEERELVLAVWRPRRLPYGYTYGPGPVRVPVPHPATAPHVRGIYNVFLRTRSISRIVKDLRSLGLRAPKGGPWSRTTVRDILTNPVYSGYPRAAALMTKTYRLPACTPVIARADFLAVQRLLRSSRGRRPTALARHSGGSAVRASAHLTQRPPGTP